MEKVKEITGELETLDVAKTAREKIKSFSSYCIENFEGDLLERGLDYIRVSTEFLNELERDDADLLRLKP